MITGANFHLRVIKGQNRCHKNSLSQILRIIHPQITKNAIRTTMKRSSINFLIDYLLAFCFCAMGGVGILLLTAVPPTRIMREETIFSERAILWGLDRHQWGFIHLTLALLVLFLLFLHVYFHWQQIKCLYRRWTDRHPVKQFVLGPLFLLTCIALLGIPCFLKPSAPYPGASKPSLLNPEGSYSNEGVDASAEPWQGNSNKPSQPSRNKKKDTATTYHSEQREPGTPYNGYKNEEKPRRHLNRKKRKLEKSQY